MAARGPKHCRCGGECAWFGVTIRAGHNPGWCDAQNDSVQDCQGSTISSNAGGKGGFGLQMRLLDDDFHCFVTNTDVVFGVDVKTMERVSTLTSVSPGLTWAG